MATLFDDRSPFRLQNEEKSHIHRLIKSKLRIHAGSALPSSVCTLMHDFDGTVGFD